MTTPIPAGWKPITSAPKNQLVMVYTPPQPSDWPDTVRISFDYIDPEVADDYWYNHGEHYEHYCCVAKPENCTGPQERAPYTHWMPLPAAPSPASVAPGDAQDGLAEAQRLAQALFQRHFAQDDDYASGRVKWEVLGDLPGVLSQIDNMVSGLVRPDAPAAGDALDAKRYRWLREKAHQTAGRAPAAVLCDESDMFQRGKAGSESGFIHGKDLDDAIDAAIGAQQGKGGE